MAAVTIRKGLTEDVVLWFVDVDNVAVDVSGDTFSSEIRETEDRTSDLIATFSVSHAEAASGIITMTLDNSVTGAITHRSGWMDVVRTISGEPTPAIDGNIQVIFEEGPTAA